MANILDVFKLFLKQNYLIQNVERVLSDILHRSEFSSKVIKQYKTMISMVGPEQNMFEIIHNNRLGDLNCEDEKYERKPFKNSDLQSMAQLDVKVKNVNNLNGEILERTFKDILQQNQSLPLGKSFLTNENYLNSLAQKHNPYESFFKQNQNQKKHVAVIISDSNSILNPKIVNQQITMQLKKEIMKQMGFYRGHFVIELQKILKQNVFNVDQVKQAIMKDFYHTTLITGNSTPQVNSPVFYRCIHPITHFPKETSILPGKVSETNIKDIFDKSMKYTKLNIKPKKSVKKILVYSVTPVSLNINVLANAVSIKGYEEFLKCLAKKNLSHKINVLGNSLRSDKTKEELLANNLNILMNIINSDNNNLIKTIYLQQEVNKISNYIRLINFLKFTEIYMIVSTVARLNYLYLQYGNTKQKREKALDVNEFFKQLQPSFNYNLDIKPRYFKKEFIQYETIPSAIKQNLELLKKTLKLTNLKIILNDYVLLSYLKKLEGLLKKIKINFNMESVLNNFNVSLCHILSTDNSQWSQQIFPSGIRKKVLLNGSKTPALYSKERENSNTGDSIQERKNILEINKKVFDDTEKNIKIIEILERLKKKQKTTKKSNPPFSGEDTTSNKEKKTLNTKKDEYSKLKDFPVSAFNTHISTLRRNKIISKVFNDIVKETIEEISIKENLTNYVMIINNLQQKSNVIHRDKTKVQNRDTNINTSSVGTLLRTPFQYRNNNTLHFNQPTNSSNIDIPLNNCTSTPLVVTQLKKLHTANTLSANKTNKGNTNKIINLLMPKLEEIVTTLQTKEIKQNTGLYSLSMQLQETFSETSNTNTEITSSGVPLAKKVESLNQNTTKEDTDTLFKSHNAKDDCKEEKNIRVRNIHNEPPLYFKKFYKTSILPECTIWNAYTKAPIKIHCNSLSKRIKSQFYFTKRYKYETKEVASPKGNKIKITCLVMDDEVNVQ